MLKTLALIIKNSDLRSRILFTFFILIIFRIGSSITIPGVNVVSIIDNNSFFGIINMLGGGALSRFSLFALGVSPYITASIIVHLLSMDIIPSWKEYLKSGEVGRRELTKITKWMALILAIIQGFALTFALSNQKIIVFENRGIAFIFIILVLVAGAMATVWLGDQISNKGIGNGLSMIIFGGIVAGLPYQFFQTFEVFVVGDNAQALFAGILNFSFFILVWFLILALMVFIDESERKIPIQYSASYDIKRKEEVAFLPLKVNIGGVIPIIFASSIINAPRTIALFFPNAEWSWFIQKWFVLDSVHGLIAFVLLIYGFTFFQAHGSINAEEIAQNLNQSSSFIPGIRSGKETQRYIETVINRICILGGTFLAFVAILPFIVNAFSVVKTPLVLGGSSMIILVGVASETYNQIQGKLFQGSYEGFVKSDNAEEQELQEKLEKGEW